MKPVEKGKKYTVSITGMTREGNGAGRIDGFAVFVPMTAPQDTAEVEAVRIKKNYAECRLVRLLSPSPQRVEPVCPHYESCGACCLMHIDYKRQLEIKKGFVEDCMRRIGGFADFAAEEIIGMNQPYFYRNKSAFPLVKTENGVSCGCFRAGSHTVIPVNGCVIGARDNAAIMSAVCSFMDDNKIEPYDENTGNGEIRRVMIRKSHQNGSIMAVIVVKTGNFPHKDELCRRIKAENPRVSSIILNINPAKKAEILGKRSYTLDGADTIEDELCGIRFTVSPHSFFQINHEQTEKLYSKVMEFAAIQKKERVMDIYCGVGTISLLAAGYAESVIGIEVVGDAVRNACENAERNAVKNARFLNADAAQAVPELVKLGEAPDVVIMDPPRKGADSRTLEALVSAAPERIVYVSCDPATLARDAAFICARGYRIEHAAAVDMFPHSGHVESVVLMKKNNESRNHSRKSLSVEN